MIDTRSFYTWWSFATWSKTFAYMIPVCLPLVFEHYMFLVVLSIALGFCLSKNRIERILCGTMLLTWLIFGWQVGSWVPYEKRTGTPIFSVAIVQYLVVQKMEATKRANAWGRG